MKRISVFLILFVMTIGTIRAAQGVQQQKGDSGASGVAGQDAATRTRLKAVYSNLPLDFEANRGQTDSRVKFLSRGDGYTLFLTPGEAVLAARAGTVRVRLAGGNPNPEMEGLLELPGKSNYFIGNDPEKWRTNIPHYARVEYKEVYPGVNVLYYGNQGQLEYDFIVAPGADSRAIVMGFDGVECLALDPAGDLLLSVNGAAMHLRKPVAYQERGGKRESIPAKYVLDDELRVSFEVGTHDVTRPLIIDPELVYSTYLGGSSIDEGEDIAVDDFGNAYVTGWTHSSNFPTTEGAFQTSFGGNLVVFITKLNAAGSALIYSTYLGGSFSDQGFGIAVDDTGNAYVTGRADSSNFPTTAGAFDTSHNGGTDVFVTKLNSAGSVLVFSTFLGGSGNDDFSRLAVDGSGNAYVTGQTSSTNFPTTLGAFDTTFGGGDDAFVTKLNTAGSALVYSTYLGGSESDRADHIAVDADGNAYVTGVTTSTDFPTTIGAFDTSLGGFSDAFVTKFNTAGSALLYSTYLGGGSSDIGQGIAIDASGNAYVTGWTSSTDFPTTVGAFDTRFNGGDLDSFVAKLNAAGSALAYSTYLGGSGNELGFGIAVDVGGNAYVTGQTTSTDFPTTAGAFDTTLDGFDAFITKLNSSGSTLAYSTYLGGSSYEVGFGIAVDVAGNAYVTGGTDSSDFPTTAGAFDTTFKGVLDDAFVTKLSPVVSTEQQLTDLGTLIDSFTNIPAGTATSLKAKVEAAQNSLANGNTTAACNQLEALINEAQAQSGKKLKEEEANAIIAAAQALRTTLGCP